MNQVKVLHVIARMNVGGTARYVESLVANIPGSILATGYVQGGEREDSGLRNLAVHRIPHLGRKISPIHDIKAYLELTRLVRELKPEIIHSHTFKAGLIARMIPGNHFRIHTFHGHLFGDTSFSKFKMTIIRFIEIFLAFRTDLLISVGNIVGVELRELGIGKNRKWKSIPPGVVPRTKINKETARNILKLENDKFIIGWIARMAEVKNPYLLMEVARILPSYSFAMAGGGDLLEPIRRSAPNNVKVLGWEDASVFLSAIDCILSTSRNEGMPVVLIEAQFAGVPAIATDVGSTCEVVIDGLTGLIVSEDAQAIADGLVKLVSDLELFSSMKLQAQKRAEENFGLSTMLKAHENIYNSTT